MCALTLEMANYLAQLDPSTDDRDEDRHDQHDASEALITRKLGYWGDGEDPDYEYFRLTPLGTIARNMWLRMCRFDGAAMSLVHLQPFTMSNIC